MATLVLSLDRRRAKADGTYPVVVSINHKGKTARVPTGVSVEAAHWDSRTRRVIVREDKHRINTMLNRRLADLSYRLDRLHMDGVLKGVSAQRMKALLVDDESPVGTFADAFQRFTGIHENTRTREIYMATWKMIERYAEHAELLRFEDITRQWLQDFFAWMAVTSPSVNARNIHLRNIRAVFNDAVENELTTLYPFRRYKIRPVPTAKRSMSVNELRELFYADVSAHQRKYLDFFLLSFMLIGINAADMLTLPPSAYKDGRIVYTRRKTGRLYNVKVEQEAAALIERYRGEELLLWLAETYQDYRYIANRININLQKIKSGLTLYWARHTWATIAAELDIPDDTIAAALGHSSAHATTAIYINRDMRKVDEANRSTLRNSPSKQHLRHA